MRILRQAQDERMTLRQFLKIGSSNHLSRKPSYARQHPNFRLRLFLVAMQTQEAFCLNSAKYQAFGREPQ